MKRSHAVDVCNIGKVLPTSDARVASTRFLHGISTGRAFRSVSVRAGGTNLSTAITLGRPLRILHIPTKTIFNVSNDDNYVMPGSHGASGAPTGIAVINDRLNIDLIRMRSTSTSTVAGIRVNDKLGKLIYG